ncbi:MAG: hypothetical protein H6652_00115 [Ardenticatenaceae bacterium]|nr:hypothetical protein [Ardenticatenaceae bacterium]
MLKPHQRTRQRQKRSNSSQTWQPHQSTSALDSWGVALRTLREQGHQYEWFASFFFFRSQGARSQSPIDF